MIAALIPGMAARLVLIRSVWPLILGVSLIVWLALRLGVVFARLSNPTG